MKRAASLLFLFLFSIKVSSQVADTLVMNYYENFPYAYMSGGKLQGIEVEIVEEYVNWLQQKKGLNTVVKHKSFADFGEFYNSVKSGGEKVVGLGSVSRMPAREAEVTFSPSYMQNVAVLITNGRVPTVREKNASEISKVFGGLGAVAVNGSSHLAYLNEIKKNYLPALKIKTVETQQRVLETIISENSIGYVDIVAYWAFLKSNPKFIKIQKVFTEPREHMGFILPKKNVHGAYLGEFFESGFGFTSTKVYHQILEKHLGYEIIESVEIK